jgi:myo-inositol-1(or 4)-monophosphatase
VEANQLEGLLLIAQQAAAAAGRFLREGWGSAQAVATKSSPTDFVSEADRRAEQLIQDAILSARPTDGFVGEEGSRSPSASGVVWLVDPIDGTTNYLRGLPNFTVSVTAVQDDRAVAAAVFDPTLDEMFTAVAGRGARLNGQSICCSTAVLGEALVGTGFSYLSSIREVQGQVIRRLLPEVGDLRRPGSAAVGLCWVACGRLDAFFEQGLQPWDFAGGALVASEAGASLRGVELDENPQRLVVAATPSVIDDLSQLLFM